MTASNAAKKDTSNSVYTESRKAGLKPFIPGVSGNPNGRPKDRLRPALRALITDEDIKAMMAQAILDTVHDDPEVRAKARSWVVEQADGKLIDRKESGDPGDFERFELLRDLSPEELRKLITAVKPSSKKAT